MPYWGNYTSWDLAIASASKPDEVCKVSGIRVMYFLSNLSIAPLDPSEHGHKLPCECGIESGLVYCWHPVNKRWVGFESNETETAREHGYTHWTFLSDGPTSNP